MKPTLREGARGQFDVVVDGETVASRERGLLTRLMGGGWPDPEDVVAAVERRLAAKGG